MTPPTNQGELIPGPAPLPAALFIEKLESTTGEYTGERLRAQRPEDYQQVIFLLAQGHGPQFIEDWFHRHDKRLSKNTAKQVRRLEGETIDLLKERLAAEAFTAADDYRDAAKTILADIMASPGRRAKATIRDVQSLEVASGIATQNAQLLSGQPTARIAIQDLTPPGHDDFNRMLASLPVAQVTEVSTHLTGETPGQKAGPSAGPTLDRDKTPGGPAVQTAGRSETDCESVGKPPEHQ